MIFTLQSKTNACYFSFCLTNFKTTLSTIYYSLHIYFNLEIISVIILQIDFVSDLSNLGIKHRLLDLGGLDKLKESQGEEQCPFFIQPHHRRRKRASEDHDDHEGHDGHGHGKS